jgi:hypothetical protein
VTEYYFSSSELETGLGTFSEKGITTISVRDPSITANKDRFLRFIRTVQKKESSVLFDFYLDYSFIDRDIVAALSSIYSSVLLPLSLSDKKAFSKKIMLLNDAGLVFGFEIVLNSEVNCTSFKAFRDLLDFSINLFPNHIFIDDSSLVQTALLSKTDIASIKRTVFACDVFYSSGRAVPWFTAVLFPLRIKPSSFFLDFAEWQDCNNCSAGSGFDPEKSAHKEIEIMQTVFLKLKYEEKRLQHLFTSANDLLRLHGAFSRAVSEGESGILELSYHPDDILSPSAMDLVRFCEEVCMEPCRVSVFITDEGPDYTVET